MFVRAARRSGPIARAVVCASCVGAVGCVSSYRYPDAKAPAPTTDASATWRRTRLGVEVLPRAEQAVFVEGLRSHGAAPFAVNAVPEQGRYVRISVLEILGSVGAYAWSRVAAETWFILPAYSDSSGYDVSFDTYMDGVPIHHYTYATRATTWAWAGLAPVVWVNFLTPSRKDAFAGIARRFLADSAVAGFVKPSDETVRAIVATRVSPDASDLDEPLSP